MNTKILWIDDDEIYLSLVKPQLENDMSKRGISAEITICETSAADAIVQSNESCFDLIILDIEYRDYGYIKNGFQLMDNFYKNSINTPVVILSNHIPSKKGTIGEYDSQLKDYYGRYIKAFDKSIENRTSLFNFIYEFISKPPLVIVALSDLHMGMITKTSNDFDNFIRESRFEFDYLKKKYNPNYLCVTGDFISKGNKNDYENAVSFIQTCRKALNLKENNTFHFCPGNHDVLLSDDNPWRGYYKFVKKLNEYDDSILQRYSGYSSKLLKLPEFKEQHEILSLGYGLDKSILFACMNSVDTQNEKGHTGTIGRTQWDDFRTRIRDYPDIEGQLRVCMHHHHLFPVAIEDSNIEARIITDQAHSLIELISAKFNLIIHGHTHHSCIHTHRFNIMNSMVKNSQTQRELNVICLPTFGAVPDKATPCRQISVIEIGFYDKSSQTRSLNIHSRIFNSTDRNWHDGEKHEGKLYW